MRRIVVVVGAVALLSCSSDHSPAAQPSSSSAAPVAPATSTSVVPTTSSPLAPIAGCPDPGGLRPPDGERPVYTATADIDPGGSVTGSVTVRFTPDVATDELVFRLWPNAPIPSASGVDENVGSVTRDDGVALAVDQPDPTTVHVMLPSTLAPHQSITVTMPYSLTIPGNNDDRVGRARDTIRLGSFLPLLAWEPGIGWATDPPTTAHAEAATSPAADYDVAITVPAGYDVLGTGQREGDHWRAIAARDVAFSVGHFVTQEADVDGVHVTLGVDRSVPDDPVRYLRLTTDALRHYEARFGAYPWPTYTAAVLPGFEGGIEFPSHVMHGSGSTDRSIVHEVAHQWFYGLVGNDQARDPWLDEGLASYAEFIEVGSLERHAGEAVPADAVGRAGDPMTYWDDHQASYYPGVYVQAAEAVAALGTVDEVDCALRQYIARNAFRVATPNDLFDAMTIVFPDAAARLAPYGLRP